MSGKVKFSIPSLIQIGSPRAEGHQNRPLHKTDMEIPGVMNMRAPRDDAEATREVVRGIQMNWFPWSYNGQRIQFDDNPDT